MDVIFSPHTVGQMQERRLSEEMVRDAIEAPDQVVSSGQRRVVHKLLNHEDRAMLLRVVLAETEQASIVVTVYLTSK